MDEADLLTQIAAGSREAFETLYRRYEQRLYRYLVGLVREAALAEELLLDVMLEVWRGAARFRGDSKVSTWLLGIARHKALSLLRRQALPIDPLDEATVQVETPEPNPFERVQAKEQRERLWQAMQTLSPQHREVLELAFVHDLSYQEIAELVGSPVNTVKTRVFYAKQKLQGLVEEPDLGKARP